MIGFSAAHGDDPGPTQRPLLAGAISGVIGTIPAIAILYAFGSLAVEARILGLSDVLTIAVGLPVMAVAGAVYSRLFGRAANDVRGGWLFGMAFGFALWAAGAVMVLPLASGGQAPAGHAAIGVSEPLSLYVDTHGTGIVGDDKLEQAIGRIDKLGGLSPRGIRTYLGLNKPIYRPTAAYGHFGRKPEGEFFPWERLDLVEDLKAAVGRESLRIEA